MPLAMGPESMATAYIGVGSNLAEPRDQVERAIATLAGPGPERLLACSRLYATTPVGPVDQPDYVNAVIALWTPRAPLDLLDRLQTIESWHGRVRDGRRWGPRTLDLDLLLYDQVCLALPGLRIPHPEIRHRAFVLIPLADIAPRDLSIPGQGRLDDLLRAAPTEGVRALDSTVAAVGTRAVRPLSCC